MKSRAKPVQMRVIEAKQRDVGKKRARITHEVMNSLGITPGDIVELFGKNRTAATVWPVDEDDIDDDVIRIDGQTRKNARVSLNDLVQVKKNNTKSARSITLLPMGDKIVVDREFCEFVKNRLKGLPLAEGDEISVVILGNPMYFKVQKVVPKSIVDINHSTKLNILADSTISKKPRVTYEEIGGLREKIEKLHEIIELPLRHPEVFQRLGIEPHKGIMLYGPPGCGKTLIAKALASESEANFFSINGPEIMNKYYGETEARLREIFKESRENAPSIVFIDEIDAIAPKREEAFGDVEKRVVAQLLALMDGLSERGNVIVIGATNRPESVDPALRRPGRFDRELEVGVPNVEGRIEVLQIHTRGMPLADDINLKKLANELHGYTGADIKALCREAAMKAMKHYLPEIDFESDKIPPEVLENMIINNKNFYDGMKEIVPTALREFYVETPRVRWENVGGLYEVKRRLFDNLITAIKEPENFQNLGISPPKGALLYGPPGCGKTLIAWALATESGANIIMVKGPEVLSKWVGESEKAIRDIFRKARASSPCIVVFDELDSIARPRSSISEDSGVGERVLSQVLTDMEDIGHTGVIVVGITNRPDLIDTSLLRPGRLDVITYIPAPDEQSRLEILKIITKKIPLTKDVNMEELAKTTKSYSGADLVGVCREAVINAMRNKRSEVYSSDFDKALRRVKPSITTDVEIWYDSVSKNVTYALPKPVDKAFYG
ncbi:MAG: AAA family ATPase [Thaumarchaeota archaeon]|nr:AAA family ATPase [Nitrososphaerota archaeon]